MWCGKRFYSVVWRYLISLLVVNSYTTTIPYSNTGSAVLRNLGVKIYYRIGQSKPCAAIGYLDGLGVAIKTARDYPLCSRENLFRLRRLEKLFGVRNLGV